MPRSTAPDVATAAVVDGDLSLSRAEVDDAAARAAAMLHEAGVGPGDRVLVAMPNRWEWLALNSALGALGAIRVAMPWRLTTDEACFIARDSGARAAVLDMRDGDEIVAALRALGVQPVLWLDEPAPAGAVTLAAADRGTPAVDGTEVMPFNAPVAVVYTSGTTGRPKGALRDRDGADPVVLAEYFASIRFEQNREPGPRRMLVTMPVHHASGAKQAETAFSAGHRLVLQRRFDAERTLADIERHRVTDWSAVPTMLARIMALGPEVLSRYDMSSLEWMSVGAAPIPPDLIDAATAYFGEGLIHHGYGCTEAGMIAGLPPEEYRAHRGSSGRPYRHVTVRIIDEDGRVLPAGGVGEICARTPQIIPGYLGRGPLPESVLDHDGFFHTGDVGRLDEDGYLFVTDRRADMIIVGGVNVYPAEVEAALRAHPDVADVAVFGVPDPDRGEVVHAVVEPVSGAVRDAAALLAEVTPRLASYKRPLGIEYVDELPRNPMGKILKARLREPFWTGLERRI